MCSTLLKNETIIVSVTLCYLCCYCDSISICNRIEGQSFSICLHIYNRLEVCHISVCGLLLSSIESHHTEPHQFQQWLCHCSHYVCCNELGKLFCNIIFWFWRFLFQWSIACVRVGNNSIFQLDSCLVQSHYRKLVSLQALLV